MRQPRVIEGTFPNEGLFPMCSFVVIDQNSCAQTGQHGKCYSLMFSLMKLQDPESIPLKDPWSNP